MDSDDEISGWRRAREQVVWFDRVLVGNKLDIVSSSMTSCTTT